MIGSGELENELKAMAEKYKLTDVVNFHGFLPPKKVREYMEAADVYLFTSNYLEGWGAVLNESMNSACAVVAGHGIGAVPFLIKHDKNGLVYKTGSFNEFKKLVYDLCMDKELIKKLGKNAYETITGEWNPKEAADRLYNFCIGLLEGKVLVQKEGPLSKAPSIAPSKGYKYTR